MDRRVQPESLARQALLERQALRVSKASKALPVLEGSQDHRVHKVLSA